MLCGFLQSYGTTWLGKAKSFLFLPPVCTGIPPNSESQKDEVVVFVMHLESMISSLLPLNLPVWRPKAKPAHLQEPSSSSLGTRLDRCSTLPFPLKNKGIGACTPDSHSLWSTAGPLHKWLSSKYKTSVTLIYLNYLSYSQLIGENTKRLRHTSWVLYEQ